MSCEESLGKINKCELVLFRNGSVHKFCLVKELITLEQVNTPVVDDDWNVLPCSYYNVISLQSRPLNFRVIIHAYSLLPQTYLRSSLTRYLGTDHLVLVGLGGGGLCTYQIKLLHKKFKRKKNHAQESTWKKIQACVLVEFVYEQVFKNTRKMDLESQEQTFIIIPPRLLK